MILPVLRQSDPARLIEDVVQRRVTVTSLTFPEELAIRRWCRDQAHASARAVQRLHDRGHLKNARRERNEHMQRRVVLLDALFSAARKRWPTKAGMGVDTREARRMHRLAQVFSNLGAMSHLRRSARGQQFSIPKSNGGTRTVTSFFWVDRARQHVLKSALTPFADLHEGQYMLARDAGQRGPAAVRKNLLAALSSCGNDSVFLHFDVRDFYGSISHAWLEAHLGINPMIVCRQVHTGGMVMMTTGKMTIDHDEHDANRETGRWGIPQGSVVSPLIAEQVMASVLRSIAALMGLPLFTWSDNLGVIVPRDRAREIGDLVTAGFAQHDAGPFQLTQSQHGVTEGFRFLGVWYRKWPDGPRSFIPLQVIDAWERAITPPHLMTAWDDEVERMLEKMEHAVRAKLARWSWCPEARDAARRLEMVAAARRDVIGAELSVSFQRSAGG